MLGKAVNGAGRLARNRHGPDDARPYRLSRAARHIRSLAVSPCIRAWGNWSPVARVTTPPPAFHAPKASPYAARSRASPARPNARIPGCDRTHEGGLSRAPPHTPRCALAGGVATRSSWRIHVAEPRSTFKGSPSRHCPPFPQRLIQLPRPQQHVLHLTAEFRRVERLLAHRSVRCQGIHDGVQHFLG
jgi:hypothetical protein